LKHKREGCVSSVFSIIIDDDFCLICDRDKGALSTRPAVQNPETDVQLTRKSPTEQHFVIDTEHFCQRERTPATVNARLNRQFQDKNQLTLYSDGG
jgi:hypothetical protein